MLKKLVLILFISIIYISVPLSNARAFDSDKIIAKIIKKYAPLYKKYKGFQSVIKTTTKEIDPSKNKQIGTMKLTVKRKDYFYKKKPEVMTLRMTKNGKKVPLKENKRPRQEPGHPLFDSNGLKHYKFRVQGFKTLKGIKCYNIQVNPRAKTIRHFKGQVYVSVDQLKLIYQEGTLGKVGMPLKEFSIKVWFKRSQLLPLPELVDSIIRVYIPVVVPDRRYISVSKGTQFKLLK